MQDKIQNLKTLLAKIETDPDADIQQKIDVMTELAWVLRDSDAQYALTLSENARSLSQQESYDKGYAHSLRNLTVLNSLIFHNPDLALTQATEALTLPETERDPQLKIRVLGSIARIYSAVTEHGQSLDYYNRVIILCEQTEDIAYLAAAINDTGTIYFSLGDYAQALQYYKKAIHLAEVHHITRILPLRANIAEIYILQHKYDEAQQCLKKVLRVCQQHDYHYGHALALNYLARIHTIKGNLDQAINTLLESKAILSNYGNSHNIVEVLIDLGLAYQKQKQMAKALDSWQQALQIAESASIKAVIPQCHQHLSSFYEDQDQWSQALHHYKKFHTLQEEIDNERAKQKVRTLQVIHETDAAKRETKIYRLKTIDLEKEVAKRTQELQEAYEQLSELDHLKSKFIADISHELRTPLANLSLYLDLLERGKQPNKKRYVDILKQQLDRLIALVETILSLSVLDSDQDIATMSSVDLNEITLQVIEKKQQTIKPNLSILFKSPEKPLFIHGYRPKLMTLVEHLLDNAIKYTPSGEIAIQINTDNKNHQLCLQIKDTGMGIDSQDMPHIFERFYRGHRVSQSIIPGIGLGMTIVKGIVMLHNGSIIVKNNSGVGTNVQVYFPLA